MIIFDLNYYKLNYKKKMIQVCQNDHKYSLPCKIHDEYYFTEKWSIKFNYL